MKPKDLTNKQFYRLKAIKIVKKPDNVKSKNRGSWWLCECECGNQKIVRSTELLRGDTKSCGCGNRFEKSVHYKGVGKLPYSKFSHIKYNAIKRNLEFTITIEYAWGLFVKQNGKCFYTQKEIEFRPRNSGFITASLDRIDSSKGYIEGNVVWAHKDVNIMKNVFSQTYFFELCKLIVDNHCAYDPKHQKGNINIKDDIKKDLDNLQV